MDVFRNMELFIEVAATGEDRLLSMPEVAQRLGIKEHRARELGRRHELPTVTVGDRGVRVSTRGLDEWIRRRETGRTIRDRRS